MSATYDVDDHMTHRVLIYEFADPWVIANWGLNAQYDPPNPAKVDWIVLDTQVTGTYTFLYQTLMRTEFKMVFDEDGMIVLHRVRPGIPDDHNWPIPTGG